MQERKVIFMEGKPLEKGELGVHHSLNVSYFW